MLLHSLPLAKLLAPVAFTLSYVDARPAKPESALQIGTTSGKVIGIINGTTPNVRQFLAVPFAQPPVNDLRWLPPIPLSNTSDQVIDATAFSYNCPQPSSYAFTSLYSEIVPEFFITGPVGEDCLTLSIWTPAKVSHPLPVLLFLYGGGFQTGGASVPYQNPAQWVERTQELIVISIQYRLGFFGFPNSAGLEDQNLGFRDQRAGMEWARDNVAAFGGDPDKMILWEQSAGAQSVDVQNFYGWNDPIVQGFISDSGDAVNPALNSADLTGSNFTFVARHFNCTGNVTQQVTCLRQVNFTEILGFLSNTTAVAFAPFPDDVVVFKNYTARAYAGQLSNKPAIFGTNDLDGTSTVPLPANLTTGTINVTLAEENEDAMPLCSVVKDCIIRNETGHTTYRYQYRGNFTNVSPYPWMGAYHASELPQLFGTYGNYRGASSAFEIATSEEMQHLWLVFAKDPQNGLLDNGWETWAQGKIAVFGGANRNGQDIPLQLVPKETIDVGASGSCARLLPLYY